MGDSVNEKVEQFIRYVILERNRVPSFNEYPFNLPCVKDLDKLIFHPNVTFIVGENGTGKSTLLEAIALAWGFNAEGGTKNFNFSSRETHSQLFDYIRMAKGIKRPEGGFF